MIGYINSWGKFVNVEKKNSFVFLLGTQKNRLNETFLLRIQTCKSFLSACLFLLIKSRISSKIKVIMDNVCLNLPSLCGAQWLNRRVAILRLRDVRVSVLPDALEYWIHQGRPIPTRLKDCWLGRKEPRQANKKPNAAILSCQAQLTNSC